MPDLPLSGAQKSHLRGLGQRLAPALKVGKGGLTAAFFAELERLLRAHELVKLRFLGAERAERAALCARIAGEGRCAWVGSVGHTALFYRQKPVPA
jgi:RNA-binding protein